jgi:hypothetical protein
MPRPHPFDFAFGSVADQWFGEIRAAVSAEARDPFDLPQFTKLAPVKRILEEMQPEGTDPEMAEAVEEYLRLLFAAYHFWASGRHSQTLSRDVLERDLPSVAALGEGVMLPVLPPTYFRLPEHQFWGQLAEGQPHEPMDGFFLVGGAAGRAEWLVVAVLGLRDDRDGFSQISVSATNAELVAAAPARLPVLGPAMPGGDFAGFHSVTSVAEMLLLVRLALISSEQ